ncbi:MAG: hypothetical protein M1812_001970 [Candelaria pacifica]|nr:MAG: hypothetical protein M1812_001970 [Candelaria pacifica]
MGFTTPNLFYLKELLSLWHVHRIPIILSVFTTLILLRFYLHARSTREKISTSPLPGSPVLDGKRDKKGWLVAGRESVECKDVDEQRQEQKRAENVGVESAKGRTLRPKVGPKRVTGSKLQRSAVAGNSNLTGVEDRVYKIQPLVFFSSMTGNTEKAATTFVEELTTSIENIDRTSSSQIIAPELHDLSYLDYDEYFVALPKRREAGIQVKYIYLLLLPTYNIDTVLNTFLTHLQETHHDFRIDTAPLSQLVGYSVFGFGDKEGWPTEEEGFCSQAREVDKWMAKLTGRKRAFPLGMGDVRADATDRLAEWGRGVEEAIRDIATNGGLGEGVEGSGAAVESDEEEIEDEDDEDEAKSQRRSRLKKRKAEGFDDLEDIGRKLPPPNKPTITSEPSSEPLLVDFTTYSNKPTTNSPPPTQEMVPVSSPTYTALTKQGYKIVGSHSGVKICRWTKSALRGRGSCYKYSFYGIKSHLCMETTPSLSCSNKCVFCWRHGTNPVGTTWRWKVDPPDLIFEGVKDGHYKKIKMMKGVPGVRAERFAEAMKIRHCALSLVGEPIFYPHINEFTALLHAEHISSFLVCNAQHPDQLAALNPVTQLYVSIDASNRDSLRKIDRPLHRDFWERFMRCLDILRQKRFRQRTVFRLTLVKGFNIEDEAEGYADLVEKGLPCFVEVKGVTYCGTSSSKGAGLTMGNVPFYEEVVAFVKALEGALGRRGLEYGIAAEHAHSCCILIASTRFLVNDKWHTLIDYERFFQLLESGKEFSPEDYMGPQTPDWATWGQGGFDPADQRVYRKGKKKGLVEGCGDGGEVVETLVED